MHHKIVLILCACIIIAAFILDVDGGRLTLFGYHPPSTCVLRTMFGIKCTLCGMTRSICATAHGRLDLAFELHRFGPPLFLFIVLQIPYRIYAIALGPRPVNKMLVKTNAVVFTVLLAAIVVNWLIYIGGLVF